MHTGTESTGDVSERMDDGSLGGHSIFLDGLVGQSDGDTAEDGGVGKLLEKAQEGAKMMRFIDPNERKRDSPQFEVVELATSMSCTGAVEYYEWVPAERLASVADEGQVREVGAWQAEQAAALGASNGSEPGHRQQVRRYFRDPVKRCIKGCRPSGASSKDKSAERAGDGEYWSASDYLLHQFGAYATEKQCVTASGKVFRYLEIMAKDESMLVKRAAQLTQLCDKVDTRIMVDENYIVRTRDGDHALLRVASIHLHMHMAGSSEPQTIAASKYLREGTGMCRPFSSPAFGGRAEDADKSKTSGYVVKGWLHQKSEKTLGGDDGDTYTLDTSSELLSLVPADLMAYGTLSAPAGFRVLGFSFPVIPHARVPTGSDSVPQV